MNAVESQATVLRPSFIQDAPYRNAPGQPTQPDNGETEIFFPGGSVDLLNQEVRYDDGQRAEISGRELDLFKYLAGNPGRIVSRAELLIRVWQMNSHSIITRTIDMHVAKLREKLHDDASSPKVLLTVRGEGYLFLIPRRQQLRRPASVEASAHRNLPALAAC